MNALSRRVDILESRRPPVHRVDDEPLEVQLAKVRAMLVAAFGEADVAAAEALRATETE